MAASAVVGADGTAKKCKANFVQTGGDADSGTCTLCEKGATKAEAAFAVAGTANTGWGSCSATGLTFIAGQAHPTGCAAGYAQTTGGVAGADAANVCTACSNSGSSSASLFAGAVSARYAGRCSGTTGYLFDLNAAATGCAEGYVQTATSQAVGTTAGTTDTCTKCPAGSTAAKSKFESTQSLRSRCTGATNGYTYSAGSIAATGCATNYVQTAASTCMPCDATAQTCLLRSSKVPTFGAYTRTIRGFEVQISNYQAGFTWACTATGGSCSVTATGLARVTGVAHATASVATITTAKAGFLAGSAASASTESLNDPGPALPTRPTDVAASVLATYTATVEVTMSLSGLTKTNFEKPAVQSAIKKGLARSYGVAKSQVTFTNIVAARRLATRTRRLAGGVSFTVVIAVLPAQKASLQAAVAATSTTTLVSTLRAEMVSAGQASNMDAGFGATPVLVTAAPTLAPVVVVKGAASQCSLTVAAVLVALGVHASA